MVNNFQTSIDFKPISDTVKSIGDLGKSAASEIFKTLDRPRGAVIAGLQLQNPIEGLLHPERYHGEGTFGIQNIENPTIRKIAGTAVDIAVDPLNIVGGAIGAKALAKAPILGAFAGVNPEAGIIKRLGNVYAINAGARGASELATAGLEQTNLPDYVKTPLEIAAGFAGGSIGARSFRAPSLKMMEEQLNQGPSYFDYLDELDKQKRVIDTYNGKDITNTDIGKAVLSGSYSHSSYEIKSALQDEIQLHNLPEFDAPIDYSGEKLIERNVNIIPASRAPIDITLDTSHFTYTSRFNKFESVSPQVHNMLTNWISDSSGTQGQILRDAFINGTEEAKILDSAGEAWRQWAHQQDTPLMHNGMVYLYRGERSHNFTPVNDLDFIVASWTSDPKVATGFTSGSYVDNPVTGRQELSHFILGKWFPIDDVIGPVGKDSYEHEFLVMDRAQISNDVYKQLRGVDKSAPQGTTVYSIFDPSTGAVVKNVDNEAEAIAATTGANSVIKVEPKPVAYIVHDANAWRKYTVVKPGKLGGYGIDEQTLKSFGSNHVEVTPIYTKDIYGSKGFSITSPVNLEETEALLNNPEYGKSFALNIEQAAIKPPPTEVRLDYEPVVRGFTPTVNSELAKNLTQEPATFTVVDQHGSEVATFKNKEEAQKFIDSFGSPVLDIQESVRTQGFKNPHTGMFDNPAIAKGFAQGPIIYGPNGPRTPSGKFAKDFSKVGGELVPVSKREGILPMSDQAVLQARQNIDPASEDLFNSVIGTGETAIGSEGVAIAPSAGLKSSLEARARYNQVNLPEVIAGKGTPGGVIGAGPALPSTGAIQPKTVDDFLHNAGIDSSTAIDPDSLDPVMREFATQYAVNKLAVRQPSDEMIRLITEGYQKAGKGDPTMLAHINNVFRGLWATADSSWFGIQGLLSLPRMLATGQFRNVADLFSLPILTLVGNKQAMGKFVQHIVDNIPEGAPSLLEANKVGGLHLAFLKGNPDFEFNVLDKLPFFKPEAAFMAGGDVARISQFYNEWARWATPQNIEKYGREGVMKQVSTALNRATGIAEKPFGGQIGSFALFAPRFFQSQIEVILKSFTDGTIEGQLARRQLTSLIGMGVTLTALANYTRGYTDPEQFGIKIDSQGNPSIDFNNPNFMRIRNIAGQDISLFGPWDSLVKLVGHVSTGDFNYVRTKFSPLLSIGYNLMSGKTFLGENAYDPTVMARGLLLPFAWQSAFSGRETLPSSALGFFGVKSSPQSASEIIDANMKNLGLDPQDPLQRREYLADHPEQKSIFGDKQVAASKVQQDIKARAYTNDLETMNNNQTLVDFRDKRTILQRELRNKLDIILSGSDFTADTQKRKWVQSYFNLFDQARDFVTHDVNSQQLDQLQAKWIIDNGDEAYTYLQNYLLVGKNPVELQYLTDMNKLRTLGYFDMPKYKPQVYKSGLTDDQIQTYRDRVSAARGINKALSAMSFPMAVRRVLGDTLTNEQISSLVLAGNSNFSNPQVAKLKKLNPELFTWFNPNFHWSDRQTLAEQANAKRQQQGIPTVNQMTAQPVGGTTG